jgi:preprotein translocase subunit SecA
MKEAIEEQILQYLFRFEVAPPPGASAPPPDAEPPQGDALAAIEAIDGASGSQAGRRAAAELAAKARRGGERNLSYQGAHDPTAGGDFIVDTVKGGGPKVGRNDPCHCGSGKKYKKCHGGQHGA